MNLQANALSFHRNHTDWSFLPTAAGGLTGVILGLAIATVLGWY